MSIYCSTLCLDAYRYYGSHVMPRLDHERIDLDIDVPASHIPTAEEEDAGAVYIEGREDGEPAHPWLRFALIDESTDFVLHENEVSELVAFLVDWLAVPKIGCRK